MSNSGYLQPLLKRGWLEPHMGTMKKDCQYAEVFVFILSLLPQVFGRRQLILPCLVLQLCRHYRVSLAHLAYIPSYAGSYG